MASQVKGDTACRADISKLFQTIEAAFSKSNLGPERWYILCAATLVGGNDPELCDQLYLHLIAKPDFSTSPQRQSLVRRLRETLVKCVSLVGVCKPLEAIMAIAERERPEDRDYSCTRDGWQCDDANLERGMGWLGRVYTHNADSTLKIFDAHRDFQWISQRITYGLYLSDRQVLDDLDTEIAVLANIMIQNLRKETHWHIRGIRRLGVSVEDVQVVWDSVQLIAKFLDMKLNRVPTVSEVEQDV